ncbi:MAG: tetratricopeptide repeat protein [Myxococcales bacterium]|nr:tetratricopeptide repeat protein [Myxococcales bacterium]
MFRRLFSIGALLLSSAALAGAPSAQAKTSFERGERELAANNLEVAAQAYREAIAASPDYAAALNGLGSTLFKQGKKEDAIQQFKAAIKADPSFKLAYHNLGYAARKLGDFATAATAYETYVKLEPSDADGLYGLGESYRQLGEAQKAIAAYEAYVQKEKRPSEQKWVTKAQEHIAALKSAPPKPAAPAIAAPATGAPPATASATAAAPPAAPPAGQPAQGQPPAKPPPGTPVASAQPPPSVSQPQPQSTGLPAGGAASHALAVKKIAEGDRYLSEKKYREASFAYQDAANADPSSIEALFKLGNTYAMLGYYAQAIERWNRVTQISPEASVKKSAQDNIARAQAKMTAAGGGSPQAQGKPAGSGPVAESTKLQARTAYEEGVRFINQRDYSKAVATLTRAIQLEPTLAVAYVARGSAHIGLKRFPEAASDYQYALRLDDKMASPLYGLAEAYKGMNRVADARTYYEKYASSTAADARTDLQSDARQKADKLR